MTFRDLSTDPGKNAGVLAAVLAGVSHFITIHQI